jgi:hypothetical protein
MNYELRVTNYELRIGSWELEVRGEPVSMKLARKLL